MAQALLKNGNMNPLTLQELGALPSVRLSSDGSSVVIIDQTRLPGKLVHLRLSTLDELCEAISSLRVRGAPALGIFAAYALAVCQCHGGGSANTLKHAAARLAATRPTAVNLQAALNRVLQAPCPQEEAFALHREDIAACRAIAEHGLARLCETRLGPSSSPKTVSLSSDCAQHLQPLKILTYCNAGPLATSRYGTALGPVLLAQERGLKPQVYACETRPLLQGARLTTWELQQAGVDTTLICDNMAATVLASGCVDAVLVGADRVAANGDVANKIGTLALAIAAQFYRVPFYVLCPSTSLDLNTATGADIIIEERNPAEITQQAFLQASAPQHTKCYNPAFDITPSALITALITENGIWQKR